MTDSTDSPPSESHESPESSYNQLDKPGVDSSAQSYLRREILAPENVNAVMDDEEFAETKRLPRPSNNKRSSSRAQQTLSNPTSRPGSISKHHSGKSLDLENPDPEVVRVVGRHLVNKPSGRGDSLSRSPRTRVGSRGFGESSRPLLGLHSSNASANGDTENETSYDRLEDTTIKDISEDPEQFSTQQDCHAQDDSSGDEFSSLKMQGGDITRQLYNWIREHDTDNMSGHSAEGHVNASGTHRVPRLVRSRSVVLPPSQEASNMKHMLIPGGFRRDFIANKVSNEPDPETGLVAPRRVTFLTRNFIEFLSIYGHFAGEELEDDEEEEEEEEESESGEDQTYDNDTLNNGNQSDSESVTAGRRDRNRIITRRLMQDSSEYTPLISHQVSNNRASHVKHPHTGDATAFKAVMLLLKSFVGTGILFLPKAFFNGGLLFSSIVLVAVALLSYWCFLLLIESKNATRVTSFGDIGGVLYGPKMRQLILASIVLSQLGFSAAYIVFTAENLQAFYVAVTRSRTLLSIEFFILLQLVIFLPLSMIRDIAKLSGTALVADFFILLGLVYLYDCSVATIALNGPAQVDLFNSSNWTLFIGTAIFTFEGIGLIIPIQESMRRPSQFKPVLAGVMVGITVMFVSVGVICYLAYGSNVRTVVILNLPQDSKFVNIVQVLYSLAIMLSTPLQLFPAVRILENGIFKRSGKYNVKIKWQKNLFRFAMVLSTVLIAWGGADDLDKFVSFIGSFACIPLVFIYPPILHYKAAGSTCQSRIADMLLIVVGILAMIYTTFMNIRAWAG